jgi:hypothetical protein
MPQIVLTEGQARIVAEALGAVEVHDATGQILAFLQPLHPQEVEAILRLRRQRASGTREPGIPLARVQAMLRKFEEIDRSKGITQEEVGEIVRRVQAGEEP